jgi:CubicO group peptidase (beta-lactamase class C family)
VAAGYLASVMRRTCLATLLLALVAPLAAQTAPTPAGDWRGAIELPGQKLDVQVRLAQKDGTWQGEVDIPAQAAKGLKLEKITVDGAKVSFAIADVPGDPMFAGELAADGGKIAGRFVQNGGRFKFALERAAAVSLDGVQKWLDQVRAQFFVPGVAVGVVRNGELVQVFTSGMRDVEQKLPVTADTLFAIGSSTKAFTTTVLATLADQGQLDWDAPVRRYLPEFQLADEVVSERLTPRDLVTHRSGMPRHDLVWYGAGGIERAELVRRLRWLPLSKDLRVDFQYNNLMLLTAGHLAERITGKSWETLVRERLFAPLGMTRSNFAVTTLAADADHAEPYRHSDAKTDRIPFRDLSVIGPAGSINSSVREMAQWVALQLDGGKHAGSAVVQSSSLVQLHTSAMAMGDMPLPDPELVPVGYGLGWMVDVYRGARRVHHGGNIDGFSAAVAFLPDKGYGFVVLTNLDATPLPELVVRKLTDRVLGLEDRDFAKLVAAKMQQAEGMAKKARDNANLEQVPGTKPTFALDAYVGEFAHQGYGSCRIMREGDGLRLDLHGIAATLAHWHFDVFRCVACPSLPALEGLRVQFTSDLDGDLDGLRVQLEPAVDPLWFERKPDAQLADPAFLANLAGTYDLGGQLATIAVQGAELTLSLPGQYHVLSPRRALVFGIGTEKGYSVRFVLGDDGKAKSARFRQPEGVYEAKRKEAPR